MIYNIKKMNNYTTHDYNTRFKCKNINSIVNDKYSLINNWNIIKKIILLQVSDKFTRNEIINFNISSNNIENIYFYDETNKKINLNKSSNIKFPIDSIIGIENICEFKNIQYML